MICNHHINKHWLYFLKTYMRNNHFYLDHKLIFFYLKRFQAFALYLNLSVAKPIIAKIIEIIQNLITTVDSKPAILKNGGVLACLNILFL